MSKETKLFKRSDGFTESSDGSFIVYPLRGNEQDGKKQFSFQTSFFAPAMTIEWSGDIAYLPEDVACGLISAGYARQLSDEEVDIYSDLTAKAEAGKPAFAHTPAADHEEVPAGRPKKSEGHADDHAEEEKEND